MNGWIEFWKWFLMVGLVIFAGLSVVISIGGFFDLRDLLRRLRNGDDR